MSGRHWVDETPEELMSHAFERGAALGRQHRRAQEEALMQALKEPSDQMRGDLYRLATERGNRQERMRPTPQEILRIASSNVILAHYIDCWRGGYICWEEALSGAVAALVDQNDRLTKEAVQIAMLRQPATITLDDETPPQSPAPPARKTPG